MASANGNVSSQLESLNMAGIYQCEQCIEWAMAASAIASMAATAIGRNGISVANGIAYIMAKIMVWRNQRNQWRDSNGESVKMAVGDRKLNRRWRNGWRNKSNGINGGENNGSESISAWPIATQRGVEKAA